MSTPTIRALTPDECDALLARGRVGRLAYARDGRVDIEPLHYVYADGWIYGRTSPHGAKMEALGREWWPVAFEVDEVDDVFHWRSVVVHGGFYPLHEGGPAWEQARWRAGVELLRGVIPQTLRDDDPVPGRTLVFRIAAQEVSGRGAEPG